MMRKYTQMVLAWIVGFCILQGSLPAEMVKASDLAEETGQIADFPAEETGKTADFPAEETEQAADITAEEAKNRKEAFERFAEGKLFAADLPETELKRPEGEISSLEDFIYLLDYLAFYRIGEKVYVTFSPSYAETFYNPYTEYQKAYQMADLADVYACQMDDTHYSDFGVVGIKYSMSRDIASVPPAEVPDTPVLPSFDYEVKERAEYPLPLETEDREEISCENGEQLYYLAMNGYRPVPETGSVAQELYTRAREVLFTHTAEDFSDFQKIRAVYDYLTTEVTYDSATAYSTDTYLVKEQAYYLEGVFFNHCAVCDGKAKACALLLNMLGIPCYRTTGVNAGGDHAWNMVQLDGKWYQLCTTYGQTDLSGSIGRIVPNDSMLLSGKETPYEWYPAQKHPDVEVQLCETAYDTFGEEGRLLEMPLKAGTIEELSMLLEKALEFGKQEYKLEFLYTGTEEAAFTEELTDFLEKQENTNAMKVKSDRGIVFEVLVWKGDGV